MSQKKINIYLHGFSETEQKRLRRQALIGEHSIYHNVDFSNAKNILEVGCGVGAQSEILLRRFPQIQLTGIDLNELQLKAAGKFLSKIDYCKNRFEHFLMNAGQMSFENNNFDGAFLCWILEHVAKPQQILMEVKRVLRPGASVYITEVMNHSFFLDPYSPATWEYWMCFNNFQYDHAGDPFVGAKLGNMLTSAGFKQVETKIINWHFDNRHVKHRKLVIDYWTELLLSAAPNLIKNKYTTPKIVREMKRELKKVSNSPDAIFEYSFMQASAVVGAE